MSAASAILVHADGSMERLEPAEAIGRWIIRKSKCGHCGQPSGPDRKYVAHLASNHDTVRDGSIAKPTDNAGCLVFVEEPA